MRDIKKRILYVVLGASLVGGSFVLGKVTTSNPESNDIVQTTDINVEPSNDNSKEEPKIENNSSSDSEKEVSTPKVNEEPINQTSNSEDSYNYEIDDEEARRIEEIRRLRAEREGFTNVKDFNVSNLVVIEADLGASDSRLYILQKTDKNGIYEEYHGLFKVCDYSNHEDTETLEDNNHSTDYFHNGGEYIPLIAYLSDNVIEYVQNTNGVLNTLELDEVLKDINKEYEEHPGVKLH